jgi:hypothetical protein
MKKTGAYAITLRTTTKDTNKEAAIALRHGPSGSRGSELITFRRST